jgi:hypothetical protein
VTLDVADIFGLSDVAQKAESYLLAVAGSPRKRDVNPPEWLVRPICLATQEFIHVAAVVLGGPALAAIGLADVAAGDFASTIVNLLQHVNQRRACINKARKWSCVVHHGS